MQPAAESVAGGGGDVSSSGSHAPLSRASESTASRAAGPSAEPAQRSDSLDFLSSAGGATGETPAWAAELQVH